MKEVGGERRRISVGFGPSDDMYAGRGLWTIDSSVTTQPNPMRQASRKRYALRPYKKVAGVKSIYDNKRPIGKPVKIKNQKSGKFFKS